MRQNRTDVPRRALGRMERVAFAVLLALPSAALALQSDPNFDNTKPETKAICARVGRPRPPAADVPTAARINAAKGCNSEQLYYGEGVPRNPTAARLCAFRDIQVGDEADVKANGAYRFRGKVILMQLYANGLGVKQNSDLATAYACQTGGAAAEYDGRIAHLQSLKAKPTRNFDYCDDVTSGIGMSECAALESRQDGFRRDVKLKALTARLPGDARALFAAMEKSFDAFVVARGDNEVDQSGSARGAFVVEEQEKLRDQFLTDLQRLLSGHWPWATAADAAAADVRLNQQYRLVLAGAAAKDNGSTVKPEGIRATQRAWLAYRDAYLRFASQLPGTSRAAVLARLTRLRLAELDDPAF